MWEWLSESGLAAAARERKEAIATELLDHQRVLLVDTAALVRVIPHRITNPRACLL